MLFFQLYLFDYVYLVPESNAPSSTSEGCPDNFNATCNLQCANGNYVLDVAGCPTCACVTDKTIKRIGKLPNACPLYKCVADCGDVGYKFDENGCRTCECLSKTSKDVTPKPRISCSRVMCRMLCVHGFRRDENGCEICSCNASPQPCPKLTCDRTCPNGFRKDYSGKKRKSNIFMIKS